MVSWNSSVTAANTRPSSTDPTNSITIRGYIFSRNTALWGIRLDIRSYEAVGLASMLELESRDEFSDILCFLTAILMTVNRTLHIVFQKPVF